MDGIWIPLSAIVLSLGMGFWRIYWDFQRRRLEYEERRAMIEKGLTPPPLPAEPPRRRPWTPDESLRRGTIMLFLGAGFGASVFALRWTEALANDKEVQGLLAIAALIILFLGLGHLVYYAIVRKRHRAAPEDLVRNAGL